MLGAIQLIIVGLVLVLNWTVSGRAHDEDFTGGMQVKDPNNPKMIYRRVIIRPKRAAIDSQVQLFPSQDQRKPGNAAPIFLRTNFEARAEIDARQQIVLQRLIDQPIAQLDVEAIRRLAPLRLDELRRAAFREYAGWEFPIFDQPLIDILLPDVHESRSFCTAIAVLARVDIKSGQLDEAYDKFTIGFGIASHIGESPMLVCKIVQSAQVGVICVALAEAIQHPDGENLYWAIANLPRPFVNLRPAFQMERRFWKSSIPELGQWDLVKDEASWERLLNRIVELLPIRSATADLGMTPDEIQDAKSELKSRAKIRLRILDPDVAERVEAMSAAEQAVRYWFLRVQQRIDRQINISQLEPHLALPLLEEEKIRSLAEYRDEPLIAPATITFENAIEMVARIQQLINILQSVESIRDWSSRNDGQLPENLDSLTLPVPNDPVTNLPFGYTLQDSGQSAILEGSVYRFELVLP